MRFDADNSGYLDQKEILAALQAQAALELLMS